MLTLTKVTEITSFKLIGENLESQTNDLLTIKDTLNSLDRDGLSFFKGNFEYRGRYTELVTDFYMELLDKVKNTLEESGQKETAKELQQHKQEVKEFMIKKGWNTQQVKASKKFINTKIKYTANYKRT